MRKRTISYLRETFPARLVLFYVALITFTDFTYGLASSLGMVLATVFLGDWD